MVERRRGAIVTMSSSAGRLPGLASSPYAAAKAGVVMLTGHLARELAPGFPPGRLGVPDDVALATLYLVSESSSWVTGVTLDISGGRVIL